MLWRRPGTLGMGGGRNGVGRSTNIGPIIAANGYYNQYAAPGLAMDTSGRRGWNGSLSVSFFGFSVAAAVPTQLRCALVRPLR